MNKKFLPAIMLLLVFFSSTSAIYLNDFLVNSDAQKDFDEFPFVLSDAYGNFSVFWTKYSNSPAYGKVYLKRYSLNGIPLGTAVSLTPDTLKVFDPARIAMHPSGSFVLAWTDYSRWYPPYYTRHIYFQQFDSLANPLGPLVKVDQNPLDSQTYVADVGMDAQGNFVIVWTEGFGEAMFARRYKNDGTPAGPIFQPAFCSSYECSDPTDPRITMHPDGQFIIVWYDNIVEFNGYVPMGRMYDSSTVPLWPEAQVLTCDDSILVPRCGGTWGSCLIGNSPDADINIGGDFMMFHGACDGEPFNNNVYGRLFDPFGAPSTHNFKVNDENANTYDLYPKAHFVPSGGYLSIWADSRHNENNGPRDIFLQRYDGLGNPIGINWRVNTPRASPRYNWISYDVACNGDKVFAVWADFRDRMPTGDTIVNNIYGQLTDIGQVGFFIPGDANFDGGISLADVIHLVNYIFKHATPPDPELWIGDVNADCRVTLADVIYLVNYIFKPGWQPPAKGCAE